MRWTLCSCPARSGEHFPVTLDPPAASPSLINSPFIILAGNRRRWDQKQTFDSSLCPRSAQQTLDRKPRLPLNGRNVSLLGSALAPASHACRYLPAASVLLTIAPWGKTTQSCFRGKSTTFKRIGGFAHQTGRTRSCFNVSAGRRQRGNSFPHVCPPSLSVSVPINSGRTAASWGEWKCRLYSLRRPQTVYLRRTRWERRSSSSSSVSGRKHSSVILDFFNQNKSDMTQIFQS